MHYQNPGDDFPKLKFEYSNIIYKFFYIKKVVVNSIFYR